MTLDHCQGRREMEKIRSEHRLGQRRDSFRDKAGVGIYFTHVLPPARQFQPRNDRRQMIQVSR